MIKGSRLRTVMAYGIIVMTLVIMILLLTYHVEHSPANSLVLDINTTQKNTEDEMFGVHMKSREGQGWWEPRDKKDDKHFGICYDAEVVNNSEINVTNWSVSFEMPENGEISELWNADWKVEDGKVIISALSYNEVIEAGTRETFGFVLYTPRPVGEFMEFDLAVTKIRDVTDEVLYWVLMLAVFTVLVVMITNIVASIRYSNIRKRYHVWQSLTEQSMRTVANTIDAKDEYTSGHSYRVAVISRMLAQKAGLSKTEQENIYYMGLLHDIGKIGIANTTLNKNGKLTEEEWEQIKRHPAVGGDILKDITSIPDIECGARYHHERWDGKGYGEGKKGEEIPLVARIICVADAYDAMSTARCYRDKFENDRIIKELKDCSGTQFDPSLTPYMIELIEDGEVSFEGTQLQIRNHPKLTDQAEPEYRGRTSTALALMFAMLSLIPIYGVFFAVFAVFFGIRAVVIGKRKLGILSLVITGIGLMLTSALLVFNDEVLKQVLEALRSIFG